MGSRPVSQAPLATLAELGRPDVSTPDTPRPLVAPDPESAPTLDPGIIEDDELPEVIERFIAADTVARERRHWIAYHEDLLRQVLEAPTWSLVLEIRRMADEREEDLRAALVRWAFERGRMFTLPPGEVSS